MSYRLVCVAGALTHPLHKQSLLGCTSQGLKSAVNTDKQTCSKTQPPVFEVLHRTEQRQ